VLLNAQKISAPSGELKVGKLSAGPLLSLRLIDLQRMMHRFTLEGSGNRSVGHDTAWITKMITVDGQLIGQR
jgi:hypothetical protein